ncbi:unnamed protein product, partial [Rotaria magnacalcarata]
MLLKSNYLLKEIEELIKQTCQELNQIKTKSNEENNDTVGQIKDKNNDDFICRLTLPYVPVPSKSLIYQIPCSCKEAFVGQTKLDIDNRMKQHSKAINDNENNSNSEMVKRFQEKKFQCLFDTNDAFISAEEKDYWKRRTKEAKYSIIS